jgi:hypothetical protein
MTPFWAFWATILITFVLVVGVMNAGVAVALIWEYGGYVLATVLVFFVLNLLGAAQINVPPHPWRSNGKASQRAANAPHGRRDPPPLATNRGCDKK